MPEHPRSPDFQRLVTTLRGGQADAIPLIELGIHPTIKEALLGRPISTVRDDAEFMRSFGYDFVKIQPTISFPMNMDTSIDRNWAPENRGVITSLQEFERYPWPLKSDIGYARLEEARKGLPDGMGVIGQYGDLFTVVWEMMGFETFAVSLYEQPELVNAMFEKVGELIVSMFQTMAEMEWVKALWFSDDIAYTGGTMVKPEILRRYFFPYLSRIGEFARRRGIPLIYHTDGTLWDVLDDILKCSVTALHPVEPKSMDIIELKRRYGDRLGLCGGIEVDLLARGTPDDVRQLVRRYIREVGPGGGWCAGSSNSIPEYVPIPNYTAMIETVLKDGAYR